jgi:hypothetical protein
MMVLKYTVTGCLTCAAVTGQGFGKHFYIKFSRKYVWSFATPRQPFCCAALPILQQAAFISDFHRKYLFY